MLGAERDNYRTKLHSFLIGFLEVIQEALKERRHGILSGFRVVGNQVAADARQRFLGRNWGEVVQIGSHANVFEASEYLAGGEELAAFEGIDVEWNAFFEAANDEMAWRSDRFDRNAESASDQQIDGRQGDR